jgi:adenosylhomocysteine nucleosidase
MSEIIGLLAAMKQESAAFLHQATGWKRARVGCFQGYHLKISQRDFVLVTSGMGIRRAAEAARTLVDIYSPMLLISFGIAGAVELELEIGDVILPDATCRIEGNAAGSILKLSSWSNAARLAITQALSASGNHLYTGTAVTTDGSQYSQAQLGELIHPILEMETAGIAQVALEKAIPFLSLRAISDGPGSPIPFDLGDVMDGEANLQTRRLLLAIIRKPGILYLSLKMLQNNRVAYKNAALALHSALHQISHEDLVS